MYYVKISILPQLWLIRAFFNSNKNVCPMLVRISGCVLFLRILWNIYIDVLCIWKIYRYWQQVIVFRCFDLVVIWLLWDQESEVNWGVDWVSWTEFVADFFWGVVGDGGGFVEGFELRGQRCPFHMILRNTSEILHRGDS